MNGMAVLNRSCAPVRTLKNEIGRSYSSWFIYCNNNETVVEQAQKKRRYVRWHLDRNRLRQGRQRRAIHWEAVRFRKRITRDVSRRRNASVSEVLRTDILESNLVSLFSNNSYQDASFV